jgi:hypothetical protein
MSWLSRVVDITLESHAHEERHRQLCAQRLRTVPDYWELLTANRHVQSYKDSGGKVHFFRVSDGCELSSSDALVIRYGHGDY